MNTNQADDIYIYKPVKIAPLAWISINYETREILDWPFRWGVSTRWVNNPPLEKLGTIYWTLLLEAGMFDHLQNWCRYRLKVLADQETKWISRGITCIFNFQKWGTINLELPL